MFGAFPTLSVRDRAIIVLNDHRSWDMLLALHRQAPRSHRPSIAGTAMPLAAAPYRASGLVLWHETVMPVLSPQVCYEGVNGPSSVAVRGPSLTHKRHSDNCFAQRNAIYVDSRT